MKRIQQVLVSFNGNQDPFSFAKQDLDPKDGPILSLIKERDTFDRVMIFSTDTSMEERAKETARLIEKRYPRILVKTRCLEIADPTRYRDILKTLRPALLECCPPDHFAEYYISVSSGTSQIHACWLLLAASGEISARILHVRERRYGNRGRGLISEIQPRGPEFPDVIPRTRMEEVPEVTAAEMEKAIGDAGIVGRDPGLLKALEDAGRVAQFDQASILILGETGTGKELFAQYLKNIGRRRSGPFIAVNCAAIPANLIESELFGYVKGAFTGADKDRIGKFQAAHEGTIFLDEIGDMPLDVQTKVLRVLQEAEITRLGAVKEENVDVQVISATNKDIFEAMEQSIFREDLYHRLSDMIIRLPSLADRRGDIPLLAQELVRQFNRAFRKNAVFSQETMAFLQNHAWPGNIRELRKVIKRTVMLSRKEKIEPEDILFDKPAGDHTGTGWIPEPDEGFSMENYLSDVRSGLMNRALELADGNQRKAAALLGITSQAVSQFVNKNRKD